MIEANYKLKVTFRNPVLGSQSTRQIMTEHLARKTGMALPEDEAESLPEALERVMTVFFRNDDDEPVLKHHQLRGFLKESGVAQNGAEGMPLALRSKVAKYVFVSPDYILLRPPDGKKNCIHLVDTYERPIRRDALTGPRVIPACSEMLPTGVWFECGLTVVHKYAADTESSKRKRDDHGIDETVLRNLLDYGYWNGLLQDRTDGFGRFIYELVREQ